MTLTPSVRAISLCSLPRIAKSFACASFVAISTLECLFLAIACPSYVHLSQVLFDLLALDVDSLRSACSDPVGPEELGPSARLEKNRFTLPPMRMCTHPLLVRFPPRACTTACPVMSRSLSGSSPTINFPMHDAARMLVPPQNDLGFHRNGFPSCPPSLSGRCRVC